MYCVCVVSPAASINGRRFSHVRWRFNGNEMNNTLRAAARLLHSYDTRESGNLEGESEVSGADPIQKSLDDFVRMYEN